MRRKSLHLPNPHDRVIQCNFSEEMKGYIHEVYIHVKAFVDDGWSLIPELKVTLLHLLGHSQCDGTSDIVLFKGNKLKVADLKYGKGIPVSPISNRQETLYALGCIQYIYATYNVVVDDVELIICQPRINNNNWDTWKTSYFELHNFAAEHLLKQSIDALIAIGQPEKVVPEWFAPSEETCMWCHRKSKCVAYNDKARDSIVAMFEACDNEIINIGDATTLCTKKHTAKLTDLELSTIVNVIPFIKSWLDGIYLEAETRTLKGARTVGLKVVEGRVYRSIRGSTEQEKVASMVKAGVPYQDAIVIKAKSPAMLEKIKLPDSVSKAVKEITVIRTGNCITAPINDSRNDVNSLASIVKHFDAFDKSQLDNKQER